MCEFGETTVKKTSALIIGIGAVLLMNSSRGLAATGDERFRGGSSDGYDSQVLIQPPDPHDWPFFKTRAAQLLTHFREGQNACN